MFDALVTQADGGDYGIFFPINMCFCFCTVFEMSRSSAPLLRVFLLPRHTRWLLAFTKSGTGRFDFRAFCGQDRYLLTVFPHPTSVDCNLSSSVCTNEDKKEV